MSRKENAVEKFKSGYTCAQAVACTFADLAGVTDKEMATLVQAFGGGIGGTMEGTCGAISGACVALGLIYKNEPDKKKAMAAAKAIMKGFLERTGSVTCKTIKGVGTGNVLLPCKDCVADVAEFLEAALKEV